MYRTEKIESWGKYRDTYRIVRRGGGRIVSALEYLETDYASIFAEISKSLVFQYLYEQID